MKKNFGIKDFLLGFLMATLLFVLMGMAPGSSSVGRYQASASNGYYVVIDTQSGHAISNGQPGWASAIDWATRLASANLVR